MKIFLQDFIIQGRLLLSTQISHHLLCAYYLYLFEQTQNHFELMNIGVIFESVLLTITVCKSMFIIYLTIRI